MPELMQCYDLSQSEIQNEMCMYIIIIIIDRRVHVHVHGVLNTQ